MHNKYLQILLLVMMGSTLHAQKIEHHTRIISGEQEIKADNQLGKQIQQKQLHAKPEMLGNHDEIKVEAKHEKQVVTKEKIRRKTIAKSRSRNNVSH